MKTEQKLLKEFYNYFYTIYSHGEIATTETRNIVDTLTDYHFSKNELNTDDYDIIFHLDNSLGKNLISASMTPDMKYFNKYNVSLDPKRMHITRRISFNPEDFTVENKDQLISIMFFLTTTCHELQHIVQFENMPELACHSYSTLCSIQYTIKEYQNSKDKKYLKRLNRYNDIFQIYSDMEKDADKASYATMFEILEKLIGIAKTSRNQDFADFLGVCHDCVQFIYDDRKVGWKIYNELYKQLRKEMKKHYNIETTLN